MKTSLLPVALAASLMGQVPAPPTIRVPVRLVTAPALVFSPDGRLVPNLQPSDFRVFDDDIAQRFRLEAESSPLSVALVIQANQDVRDYTRFISKVGSAVEILLLGESGEAAVVLYRDEVTVAKPFDSGSLQEQLRNITPSGKRALMIDAGMRAIGLLAERPASRSRVLIFIGQPSDHGSEFKLETLRDLAQRQNVMVFALRLPEFGKTFVEDNVSLEALSSRTDRGGWKASVDLGKLISSAGSSGKAAAGADPFTLLTTATGGTQHSFRKQAELEKAISGVGVQLRSLYQLSYTPSSSRPGYHSIRVEVSVPGVRVLTRPGYWLAENAAPGASR